MIELTQREMSRHIANRLDIATRDEYLLGQVWYLRHGTTCRDIAIDYGYSTEQIVAALAIMSPRVHWSRNVNMTRELAATGHTTGLKRNIAKAKLALASDDPLSLVTGQKTSRFAQNLLGNLEPVTVDVWALRCAGLRDTESVNVTDYRRIEESFRSVAARRSLEPAVVQAIAWVVERGKAH